MARNIEQYRPTYFASCVASIDFELLANDGICHAIIDLDATLAPVLSMRVCEASRQNLLGALNNGWLLDVCILSNAWLYPFARRVETIARRCGFKHYACFWPRKAKPHWQAFELALATMPGADPSNTVSIGDQLNTDILGANLANIRSLLIPMMEPVPWWKCRRQWNNSRILRALNIYFTT